MQRAMWVYTCARQTELGRSSKEARRGRRRKSRQRRLVWRKPRPATASGAGTAGWCVRDGSDAAAPGCGRQCTQACAPCSPSPPKRADALVPGYWVLVDAKFQVPRKCQHYMYTVGACRSPGEHTRGLAARERPCAVFRSSTARQRTVRGVDAVEPTSATQSSVKRCGGRRSVPTAAPADAAAGATTAARRSMFAQWNLASGSPPHPRNHGAPLRPPEHQEQEGQEGCRRR